jgi:hypothetical protein
MLFRFDSVCRPGAEWRDVPLSTRRSMPPGASTADPVVGVEAAVGDGTGGLGNGGNGALNFRRERFEKDPGLNRPAVAWLPVFGLDSFWDVLAFRGASLD